MSDDTPKTVPHTKEEIAQHIADLNEANPPITRKEAEEIAAEKAAEAGA